MAALDQNTASIGCGDFFSGSDHIQPGMNAKSTQTFGLGNIGVIRSARGINSAFKLSMLSSLNSRPPLVATMTGSRTMFRLVLFQFGNAADNRSTVNHADFNRIGKISVKTQSS